MTRRLLTAAVLLAVAPVASAQPDDVHTFQVREGAVYFDGRLLPDAVPDHLDLSGITRGPMEFSGPITPVLEVDGEAYVLENGRLVLLAESSRAGQGVYILDAEEDMADMPRERVQPIVEAAYMRDVASRNSGLFGRMQREQAMEAEVARLTERVRQSEAGPERRALRDQLRGLLSDLLALKHEIRAEEIVMAEQRLESARRSLVFRESHHDAIVDGRLQELVGDQ